MNKLLRCFGSSPGARSDSTERAADRATTTQPKSGGSTERLARLPPRLSGPHDAAPPPRRTIEDFKQTVAALGKAARSVASQRSAPADQRAPLIDELNARRQELVAQFSALSERSRLPGRQAEQTYVRLERATAQIMETPGAQRLSYQDAQTLHALLLTGLHHHRWTTHSGMPASKLPPFEYQFTTHSSAFVRSNLGATKTLLMSGSPNVFSKGSSTTIAHEGLHEAQFNAKHWATSRYDYKEREARFDTSNHPLAEQLEVARALPSIALYKSSWAAADCFLHASDPVETQALAAEAAAKDLSPLTKESRPLVAGAGMESVVGLLLGAAKNLLKFQESASATKAPKLTFAKHIPHAQVSQAVEKILFQTGALAEAMDSEAWTPAVAERVGQRVQSLAGRIAADAGAGKTKGLQQLRDIGLVLTDSLSELRASQGDSVHKPRGSASGAELEARFTQVRHDPVRTLERVLAQIAAQPDPDPSPAAQAAPSVEIAPLAQSSSAPAPAAVRRERTRYPAAALPQLGEALNQAKAESGFLGAVQAFLAKPNLVPEPEAVADAVMRLASRLVGLPKPGDLPAVLMPQVHLYEARSLEFERIAGFNAPPAEVSTQPGSTAAASASEAQGSRQKRKAGFDVAGWQLHVPEHFFHASQAGKLEARMSGLAADVAHTIAVVLVVDREVLKEPDKQPPWTGLGPVMDTRTPVQTLSALGFDPFVRSAELDAAGKVVVDKPETSGDYASAAEAFRAEKPRFRFVEEPERIDPALRAHVRQYIADHPASPAAALRSLVETQPKRYPDLLWHVGPRAQVKHDGEQGVEASREAYQARTLQRWEEPTIAFRRAVIGPRVREAP